jgi:mannose-6-phosphate isomerase-like protein (cupin superfamily)
LSSERSEYRENAATAARITGVGEEAVMKIERDSLAIIDFEGLEIRDYTAGTEVSSSVAEVTVPAGARHRRAWSKRSDKYYYVLEGSLSFTVGVATLDLTVGDCCIVRKGNRFSYRNPTGERARVLLVHTPSFDLADEVLEDEPSSSSGNQSRS